jgi:hypothetical protein
MPCPVSVPYHSCAPREASSRCFAFHERSPVRACPPWRARWLGLRRRGTARRTRCQCRTKVPPPRKGSPRRFAFVAAAFRACPPWRAESRSRQISIRSFPLRLRPHTSTSALVSFFHVLTPLSSFHNRNAIAHRASVKLGGFSPQQEDAICTTRSAKENAKRHSCSQARDWRAERTPLLIGFRLLTVNC